ncbi:leucine-rich repeat domain-containing protein [Neolewinella persica]|uniref:leucine-rich repeat domain-containing protein n=1 Tax=Neolewinella persica TaxID=70998 RepID=UPI000378820C|nr:hypothetical protein [Neolewinella persica]
MAKAANRNRYPGVQPFRTEQQGIFFGREEDTQRLFSTVSGERLTVLYGKSGYGKSSLIQAGLLPWMTAENDRGRRLYLPLVIHFNAWQAGADLFDKYRFQQSAALKAWGIAPTSTNLPATLPKTLWGDWKRQNLPDNAHLVLIFDQFEEFFTYPTDQQAAFKEQLAELLYTDYPRYLEENDDKLEEETLSYLSRRIDVRALFSIRSDRLSELDRLQDRLPAILHKRLQLGPLSPTQAQAAIVQPALLGAVATGGHDFASPPFEYRPDTLAHLLKTLQNSQPGAGGGVEAFLLQVFCNAIEARVIAGEIPDRDGNGLPDVEVSDLPATNQVMEDYYARQIGAVAPGLQPVARRMIEDRLVQVAEDGTGLRMSVDGRALLQEYRLEGVDQPFLDRLVESYLLRREPNSTGGLSYELSHDTLLVPALASRKGREERLAAALLEEQKLAAEAKLKEQEAVLLAEQKKRRRERLFGGVMAVLAVLAVGAFVWALGQRQEAEEAQADAQRKTIIADSLRLVAEDNITEAKLQTSIAVAAKDTADQQREIANEQTRLATSARNEAVERAARAAALNEALAEDDAFQYLLDRGNDFFGEGAWRDAVTYWGAARFFAEEGSLEEALAEKYLGIAKATAKKDEQILKGEIEESLAGFRELLIKQDTFLQFTMTEIRIAQLESTLGIWEREVGSRDLTDIDSIYLGPVRNDYPLGIISIPKAIKKLDNLTNLVISSNYNLFALPSWEGLEQLQKLEINSNDVLSDLPTWEGLEQLQKLEISGNNVLSALPSWQGLDQLQKLEISASHNLDTLPSWQGLEKLQQLILHYNNSLSDLPTWEGLEQLQKLEITNNYSLYNLPTWQGLGRLQKLVISGRLDTLPAWQGLEQLQTLEISNNSSLWELPNWQGLNQLQKLEIWGNNALRDLPTWQGLDQLQKLEISGNEVLSDVPTWKETINLQRLNINYNRSISSLSTSPWSVNIDTLFVERNALLDSLPPSNVKTNKINVLFLVMNGDKDKQITLNDWLGFAEIKEIYLTSPIYAPPGPYLTTYNTSPNIHTLPKTFINLAPTLKILDLRGTSIPPEEVAYWRKVLPDTDIRYEME